MQWNCTSPNLQNLGYDPFSINKAISYPQIIGEGDITSLILPDGSIQLYFVPTNRQVALAPFQFNTNFPNQSIANNNKDIWFVRSISQPLPLIDSMLNGEFPNVFGDQQLPPQNSPNFCINSPLRPGYYLKFHNDASTSTTDIHYFYPSLRYNSHLKYSAEIQTEPLAFNTNAVGGCQNHCGCRCAETVKKKVNNGDASASSTSYMSVDSASKSKHRLTKRNKKKSTSKANKSRDCGLETKKSKYKTNKSRDHSSDYDLETKENKSKYKINKRRESNCECNLETKKTSDKLVTTFADQASGSTVKGGRHTQTATKAPKRSDIKTELWIPIDSNSSSTLKLITGDSSDQCHCRSTSEDE